ncbi:MAG: M14 family zinc carboxypeptidase, partial [Pseudomonadota bacterium]
MKNLYLLLCLALGPTIALSNPLTAPNWTRERAFAVERGFSTKEQLATLLDLARTDPDELAASLDSLARESSQPAPVRERLMLELAQGLKDVPPLGGDLSGQHPAIAMLLAHEAQVLVPHEELPGMGVPLYPVRAAAAGSLHQWRYRAARDAGTTMTAVDAWLEAFLKAGPAGRRGLSDALRRRSDEFIRELLALGLPRLADQPALTLPIGEAALALRDLSALSEVLRQGGGAGVTVLARRSAASLPDEERKRLLKLTGSGAPAATAAMLEGVLNATAGHGEPQGWPKGSDGQIERWTEADGVLGLGYPVPVPVDTPLPFDGFRSYAGLRERHQALADGSTRIQGFVLDQTDNGREIWGYRLSDSDALTRDLLAEPAMLTNGGIHAREWQTPEVVTAVMERLSDNQGDNYFHDYLLENTNIIVLPVMNVDGFLQTQRFPTENWLRTDPFDLPDDPSPAPRDGRMRRKNMPGVDEDLESRDDHLLGVDLNRNSPPFHASNPNRSSSDERSLVHHGAFPHSEPELQALLSAVELGPAEQLRAYTDVHSFSQVFYFNRSDNVRLTNNTVSVLDVMSNHNAALPNGSLYLFDRSPLSNINTGFGLSNEYFTQELGIVAWGVEVEPTAGQSAFPDNPPGCGADYGGLGRNCHDGFILPESEIRRVRRELSQSFLAAYFHQAGPPSVAAVRVVDRATDALVFQAEWDPVDATSRELYVEQLAPLVLDREYTLWIAHDRPMRWRDAGQTVVFPGQPASTLAAEQRFAAVADPLAASVSNSRWASQPGDAPEGYFRYQEDALVADLVFPASTANLAAIEDTRQVTLSHRTLGLTGHGLDANPGTPIGWADGGWSFLEDENGRAGDSGGADSTVSFEVSRNEVAEPFLIQPGTTAAWFDEDNTGEGFVLEILADSRAVMYWFTYDVDGNQAWYVASGEVRGNRLVFPELVVARGGRFGP